MCHHTDCQLKFKTKEIARKHYVAANNCTPSFDSLPEVIVAKKVILKKKAQVEKRKKKVKVFKAQMSVTTATSGDQEPEQVKYKINKLIFSLSIIPCLIPFLGGR